MAVGKADGYDHDLLEIQVFLPFQRALHVLLVFSAVGLRAQRVNRRAFAEVEHPVLDTAAVRSLGHFAAQCVEFAHQMSLSGAADKTRRAAKAAKKESADAQPAQDTDTKPEL